MDETTRRRTRFALVQERRLRDGEAEKAWAAIAAAREERHPEALALRQSLARDLDLAAFRSGLEAWTKRPGYESVSGFPMMFVNQIVKRAQGEPADVARLLADVLDVPRDEDHAEFKIRTLVDYVHRVKRGGHPAPGHVPFLVSLFWSMSDHEGWPCLWPSAEEMLKALGWLVPAWEQPERYTRFRRAVLDLGERPREVERTLYWFKEHPWVGLDPALRDRCAENASLLREAASGTYPDDETRDIAERNARIIRGEVALLAHAAADRVGEALGRTVTVPDIQLRTAFSRDAPFRSDGFASWSLEGGMNAPSARVWVTQRGVAIGVHPGWAGEGSQKESGRLAQDRLPEGAEFFLVNPHGSGNRLDPAGLVFPGGECFVGRWYPGDDLFDREDLADLAAETALDLRHVVDAWVGLPSAPPSPEDEELDGPDLSPLVDEFVRTRPYRTEKDEWHHTQRKELAERLTEEALAAFDVDVLRIVANGRRYGSPGPQSRLNATLTASTPQQLDDIARRLSEFLWSEDDEAERIDRVLDQNDLGFPGLGESVALKLLAIVHPDRFLPTFPYTGDMGKASLMRLIGLEPPSAAGRSRGQLQVLANDMIRERLDPYFPDDPWAQGQFLYWLKARGERPPEDDVDVLEGVAKELLVERAFVEELVELLHDKGQIVLYGPPGTGKTFLARKLAATLAPDPTRRTIVQFHPSTSYEDFFEGYRPIPSADGGMTYELVRGPLARLAERAEAAPGIDHVLVIDEINRANLPKVLGELLFLLEYREESVATLYRGDEGFELPRNLLLIGTMNTADRSVALVDAALRRRFHFVPFFPNEGPMQGLLDRWLAKREDLMWVAELVDLVNEELRERLGGSHLQVGPSHFMRDDLDEARIARIWAYDVFPFIEEELFGDRAAIEAYRFDRVLERLRDGAKAGVADDDGG